MALVHLKIEDRPRETQVDRSYANIGFVAHRKNSIIDREFLPLGSDLPGQIFQRGKDKQTQRGITGDFGYSQASPLAKLSLSYNRNDNTTMSATDTKAMPRCYLDHEIGNNGPASSEDDKSYSSYNIVYRAQTTQLDRQQSQWHPVEVTVGMGINLDPPGLEKPLPKISFVNRHQVLIWVSDPASKSRIRGIVVLLNNYLDNIRTKERLSVLEKETVDLNQGPLPKGKTSKFTSHYQFIDQ
ncbi:hypothetical protein K438DRAFT_1970908 [Mycena galopus ATCC 62051]|nr:hypothetical protein K438DRAFT_1970908 [Mycena galopus ATCC 62051]